MLLPFFLIDTDIPMRSGQVRSRKNKAQVTNISVESLIKLFLSVHEWISVGPESYHTISNCNSLLGIQKIL